MEGSERVKQEEFRRKLRQEWELLWKERFDDKFRAEGIAARDYPLLFTERGYVIFASKDAKTPSFCDIRDFWASQGLVYSPDPAVGGWGKFIRKELGKATRSRRAAFEADQSKGKSGMQQLKKGGRGWLHTK